MKDLEKIFYGNVAAYDAAILPEAAKDELSHVIWRLDNFPFDRCNFMVFILVLIRFS